MTVKYSQENPLKLVELFAGIGSQIQAIKNLGIPVESKISEIDSFAVQSYNAINGPTENLGDITKVKSLPECDVLTYSFPCQDLSTVGTMRGMIEGSGTRSSLLWEVGRVLKNSSKLPEILVMENVFAILNKKNKANFEKWMAQLEALGYTNSYAVLNAKDFGVPQSRRRCFMVSSLNGKKFVFPEGTSDELPIKIILEDNAPKDMYFKQVKIEHYEEHKIRNKKEGRHFGWNPNDGERLGVCLTTSHDRPCSEYIIEEGTYPDDVYTGKMKVRPLTPLESWRMMGFPDESFYKAKATGISKTQLYKQAGNSIVVNVLEAIFKGIYIDETWEEDQ